MAEIDDIAIEPPESTDYESLPTGAYMGKLVAFKVIDKPEWKIQAELLRKPEKEPDREQWTWQFEVIDGEFAGITITDYTNRSWHERSKAAAHACALLDVPALPRGQGLSTGKLIGRPCQVWVVAKEKDDGSSRSYVDKVLPLPKRARKTPPSPVQGQHQASEQEQPPIPPLHPFLNDGKDRCQTCGTVAQVPWHEAPKPAMAGASGDDPELGEDYWQQLAAEAEKALGRR